MKATRTAPSHSVDVDVLATASPLLGSARVTDSGGVYNALAAYDFAHARVRTPSDRSRPRTRIRIVGNLLWLLLSGIEMAVAYLVAGLVAVQFVVTIPAHI